jgi:sugar lactone lactonase YvrE
VSTSVTRRTVSATAKKAALVVLLMVVGGCQQGAASPTASPSPHSTPTATPLAACPLPSAPTGPQVVVQKLPAPDDLAFGLDERLLFSDINTGAVSALNADGSVERIAAGLSAPEGIVPQGARYGSGRLLVAEQGRNRITAIDPQSHATSLWRAFPNRTGRDGIDGIGPELSNGDIVVPDSPNGVVWRVSADGKSATQIASGMVRPVGAAVDAAGRIFVADEGGALWVLDPARHRFATLPTPDDVLVGKDGHILVNALGDNAIHELDAQGHQLSVLSRIQQPQGIALDGADNLYYTEFNSGRIDRVIRNFVLGPATVTRTAAGGFVICPVIQRAPGFTRALRLSMGSSPATSILGLVQPGTDSSGALAVRTSQPAVTITIDAGGGGPNLAVSQTVRLSP